MSGIGIDTTYGGWVSTGGAAPTLTATAQSGPWRASTKTFAGTNLTGCTGVTINGVACTGVSSTSTSVTVTTPAFSANGGPYNVVATTAAGNSGSSGNAIYSVLWDPLDSTPGLWLDANVGVTTSGGHVTAWADQSGNANNATGSGNWTIVTGWSNGKSSLLVDGTTVLSGVTAPTTAGGACWYLFVGDSPSLAGGGQGGAVFVTRQSGTYLSLYELHIGGSQYIESDGVTNVTLTTVNVSPFANPLHFEWSLPATGGTPVHTIAGVGQPIGGGTRAADSGTGYVVGGNTVSAFFWSGHIAEVVAIDHAPTAAEIAGWTAYAKTKYGLSV